MDFHLTLTGLSALRRNWHPINHTNDIIARFLAQFNAFRMYFTKVLPNSGRMRGVHELFTFKFIQDY